MVEASALLVDAVLPEQPIRQWVLSVPYPLRFLFASQLKVMGKVLGIVYRMIASHLLKKARVLAEQAQTGAVTLIQRFGSALNLNIHFHMLFLDGVYAEDRHGVSQFFRVKAPSHAELVALAHQLSHRVGRYLERQGLLSRDPENAYLAFDFDESNPMPHLQGSSIQYRIAVGAQQGRKALQLQTVAAAYAENTSPRSSSVAKVSGFSLHAGVCAQANERNKLEQLCRYITRPAISEKRLSLTGQGNVRIQLKTAYRDGTTHVVLEPLDFIARLAALVPAPRVNLTRFHEAHPCASPCGQSSTVEIGNPANFSWCVRTAQRDAISNHSTQEESKGPCRIRSGSGNRIQSADTCRTPSGNDLGTATQARIWY